MTSITNLPPDNLIAIYLFANTPSYLYRHFRISPYVKALADNIAPEEIARHLNDLTPQKLQIPNEATLAYALLVSLTFFDYDTAFRVLTQINLSSLDWGDELRDIFLKTAKSTKVEYFTPTFSLLQQPIRLSPQSTSTTSIVRAMSPRSNEGEERD